MSTVINPGQVLKEREARSVSLWQITDESVSKAQDFTPMETDDNSSGKIVIELNEDGEYPSTLKVKIPTSQKGIVAKETLVALFEANVNSNLQFFISPSVTLELKLCYIQLVAFLTESTTTEDEHLCSLKTHTIGDQKFVLAKDVLLCLIRLKRHVYSDREICLITDLKRRLNFDYGTLSTNEKLTYLQNHTFYLMRNSEQMENELFKKLLSTTLTNITEASRVTRESNKIV